MTKPTPEEIIAGKIMWAKAKPTECNHALAKDLMQALADAGYQIIHEDDIGKVPVRVVERVPFVIEES